MSNMTDRERAMLEALKRIRDFAPTVTHGWADCVRTIADQAIISALATGDKP